MNSKLPRIIAKPLHSTTTMRVMLEPELADAIRTIQRTHPALIANERHVSFSLIVRRALTLYVHYLEAIPPADIPAEQQAVLRLS